MVDEADDDATTESNDQQTEATPADTPSYDEVDPADPNDGWDDTPALESENIPSSSDL